MATAKTSSFWLTEAMDLTALGTVEQSTIDLGAYVDVGDQQAVAIEQVDFIYMHHDLVPNQYSYNLAAISAADFTTSVQLTDLNPGQVIVRADDRSLVAGGALMFDDSNNTSSMGADLYPDEFGPKLSDARIVVNDQLYLNAAQSITGPAPNQAQTVIVRIKAKIVKLSTKDWMAIAIQSTAADN